MKKYYKSLIGISVMACIGMCMIMNMRANSSSDIIQYDDCDTCWIEVDYDETDTVQISEDQREAFDAGYVFTHLDVKILDILEPIYRGEMIRHKAEMDSTIQVYNEFGGISYVETLTQDYLKVSLTDVSNLQIKILPGKKAGEKLALVIYTIGGKDEAADSQLFFFTGMELKSLPADKFIKSPQLKEFFKIGKGYATSMKEIESMIPFPTVEYTASPSSETITATLTSGKYITQDDYNIIKLFMIPEIQYRWNGKKFNIFNAKATNKK